MDSNKKDSRFLSVNPAFKKKESNKVHRPASYNMKKRKSNLRRRVILIEVLVVLSIIVICICMLFGLSGRTIERDGHYYKVFGPYNIVHDPDCPCN